MRHHHAQPNNRARGTQIRGADGVDMQQIGSRDRSIERAEEACGRTFRANRRAATKAASDEAHDIRAAWLAGDTASEPAQLPRIELGQPRIQVFGVLLDAAFHVREAAQSEHHHS